jgi:hypothetical protein
MKVTFLFFIFIVGSFVTSAAQADIKLKYMAMLHGDCLSAKVNETDFTEQCKNGLSNNTSYQNGYVSFGFSMPEGARVSFAGNQDSQSNPNEYQLNVSVVTEVENKQAVPIPASGKCTVSGNITKKATVTCEATTEKKITTWWYLKATKKPT